MPHRDLFDVAPAAQTPRSSSTRPLGSSSWHYQFVCRALRLLDLAVPMVHRCAPRRVLSDATLRYSSSSFWLTWEKSL